MKKELQLQQLENNKRQSMFQWNDSWNGRLIIFCFFIIGLLLLPLYRHVINVDGIQYIGISEKYLIGNFNDAINGLWSPLISWLLVPFLFFKIDPVISFKILALVSAVAILIGTKIILNLYKISEKIKLFILFSLSFLMLYDALIVTTPDLLQLGILIFYLAMVFDEKYVEKLSFKRSLFIGLLGALSYFAKAYNFYFFIIHFSFFNIFLVFNKNIEKNDRKKLIKFFSISLISFIIIILPWVIALTNKYKSVTISTSGKINFAWIGPAKNIKPGGECLTSPPNSTALSSWEDPYYLPLHQWSPLQSKESFIYQLKIVAMNMLKMREFFYYSFSVLIIFTYYFIKKRKDIKNIKSLNYLIFTMLLYVSGYMIIDVQPRYIWIAYIILFIISGCLLSSLFDNNIKSKKLVFLFIFLYWIFPPTKELITRARGGDEYVKLAQTIHQYDIKGNIASNYGTYEDSFYTSYYLNSRYYGQIRSNETSEELCADLENNFIDYYFSWQIKSSPEVDCKNYYKIKIPADLNLAIYKKAN